MRDPVLLRRQVVLVVDDDEPTRAALQDVLLDAGYVVATAADGDEAVEVMHGMSPDAVVLDLMMPKLDGWSVATWMRQQPHLMGTPIVIMTAHGAATLARAPVASAYLSKPVGLDRLLGALSRAVSIRPPPPPAP